MTTSKKEKRGSSIDLAEWIEKTDRGVRDLVARGVLHREPEGDFILPKATREYYAHIFRSKEEVDYNREKAKHEQVKRQLAELELARRRHEVHSARDVELIMTDNIVNARTLLLGIPTKVVPKLINSTREEMFEILTKEIKAALCELAEYKPTMFDVEAAAPNDNNSKEDK